MNKSSIMALLATVVLSVPASAYESLEISETSAENASELFGPSVNAIFHGVESLLDSASVESTLGDISHDGIALSFDLTSKISNVVYDVVRGTWTVTTDASAKVLAPSWEVSTNAAGYISKSVVFKSLVEFSTDVVTSDGAVKASESGGNVASAYSDASLEALSLVSEAAVSGLKFAANAVNKAVVVTVNGAKATANWSENDVLKADDKSAAPAALSTFVAAKFVNALKSSGQASEDLVSNEGWAKSGLAVSIVKAAKSSWNYSKETADVLWVVVTTGSTEAYNLSLNGDYSKASEVLLMLPLQSVQGAYAVSTSTRKSDELGQENIPDVKKKVN